MSFEFGGKTIETSPQGNLAGQEDWSEDLAKAMAAAANVALGARRWGVINYLRNEFFDNRENQPNTRAIIKAMSREWGAKIKQGDLCELFPGDPSKQGGRIAGLPESRRKGGY